MDYALHVVVMAGLFSVLACALNIVMGYGGMLALVHAAYFGIGSYVTAIMSTDAAWPLVVAMPMAVTACAILSLASSLLALRTRDDFFAISTFALQMVTFGIFNNWTEVTRGPLGIVGIPRPTLFTWRLEAPSQWACVVLVLVVVSVVLTRAVAGSPFGRVLRAIREDEILAHALGKSVVGAKLRSWALSAALSGAAGAVYAPYITFIDPTSFTVNESILVVSMVILGGSGTIAGPVLGAVVLVTLPELLRLVGLPSATAANLRQLIYGVALVLMLLFCPRGILGLRIVRSAHV